MPDESYTFDEQSYEQLNQAGISPLAAADILYSSHLIRRYIDPALQIAGQDRTGTWLAVLLIETTDDQYTVVSARRLTPPEIAAITKIRGDQP